MESGWFDNFFLDIDKVDVIVKMLDVGVWIGRGGGVWRLRFWLGNRSRLI